jgi:hypothetical protein
MAPHEDKRQAVVKASRRISVSRYYLAAEALVVVGIHH